MVNELLTCPTCNGTGRKPAAEHQRNTSGWYGYNVEDDSVTCTNCGAQYMSGKPSGWVRPRKDNGEPCQHLYDRLTISRCYHRYTCQHCGDVYHLDSGD